MVLVPSRTADAPNDSAGVCHPWSCGADRRTLPAGSQDHPA